MDRAITTDTVRIPVADGTTVRAHRARPDGPRRGTAVVVVHELFGVNPDIRGVVDDLARAGHVAIAPEFYHRHTPAGRWFERDDAGRAEGFAALHRLTRDGAVADVAAAVAALRTEEGVDDVGLLGFSAGGHLAYLAAARLPVSRTAVLYAGWLPTTDIPLSQPEPTLSLTPGIEGRLLYLVGDDDRLVDRAQRAQIRAALARAGTDHEVVAYPGVQHAFFWPDTPAYDAAARADAWGRVLELFA